jgi:hypothetical protein
MISSIFRLVTVPCLEKHHEPAENVRSYCHSLSVDGREPEIADYLVGNRSSQTSIFTEDCYLTVGKKYEIVATPTLTVFRQVSQVVLTLQETYTHNSHTEQ